MMIKYVGRRNIQNEKWNRVIASSGYETIYPYTWYLDACADHWGAFVMPDYECVMPVAFRKKIGMPYTYQPLQCQQLGVYSAKEIDVEVTRMFLQAMQERFRMGDYALNEGNLIGDEPGFEVTDNMNYVLPLDTDYAAIQQNYSENCRRNLKSAGRHLLRFDDDIAVDEIISLKKHASGAALTKASLTHINNLLLSLKSLGRIRIFGAREGNHLVAAAVFAFSEQRGVFLLSASSEAGKEHRAMFMVVDQFIQMYAGKVPKLDFEGSNIPSIARFFRGFGAKPQVYQRIAIQNSVHKMVKILRGG